MVRQKVVELLSAVAEIGAPIKFIGTGENMDDLKLSTQNVLYLDYWAWETLKPLLRVLRK